MSLIFPEVSRQTARILSKQGFDVLTPREVKCCGAPHLAEGDRETATRLAEMNVALFNGLDVDYIVTDCAGCSAALKEYAEWLHDDPVWAGRAAAFSARVRDITEWLAEIWPDDLPLRHAPLAATYHDPCHLANLQSIRRQPRQLLARVQGLECRPLPDSHPVRCCGSAGIYNLTHTAMSLRLLDRKMADVAETGAQLVVSANPGCLMQLEWGRKRSGLPITVKHVVQVLDESLPVGDAPSRFAAPEK